MSKIFPLTKTQRKNVIENQPQIEEEIQPVKGNIDVTVIATKRPEILNIMLRSFKENLSLSGEERLIINVDPVGLPIPQDDVIKVCYKYFKNVTYNTPTEGNATKALKWVWKQTTAEYVLSLEDDWELINRINVGRMISIMERIPNLAQLSFRWTQLAKQYMRLEGYFYSPNFTGAPSLLRGSFARRTSEHMNDNLNFEKQLKYYTKYSYLSFMNEYKYGQYTSSNKLSGDIIDHGRGWMKKYKFGKNGTAENFLTWR